MGKFGVLIGNFYRVLWLKLVNFEIIFVKRGDILYDYKILKLCKKFY